MELNRQPTEYVGGANGRHNNCIPLSVLGSTDYRSYGGDIENDSSNQPKNLSFSDESIRRGFIRKVYLILLGQLLATFGVVSLFVFNDNVKQYVKENFWIFCFALIIMLITMLALICCENLRRETPTNFIFLSVYTMAQSFLMGVSACRYGPNQVLLAVGITAILCLALTLFALQTKYDFTASGGILVCCLVILIIFGIVAVFVNTKLSTLIYASFSALLFSAYLIYDTQLMLGGKHKYSISPEEYIFAALNLYLDVVNILMDILTILDGSD